MRTVASISASIPSERWNCDTTLILLGVGGVIVCIYIGDISGGGVERRSIGIHVNDV